MADRQRIIERRLAALPLYDYRWIQTSEIDFNEKVRTVCRMNDCGMYGRRWHCPPAIGTIGDCIERVKKHPEALVFSTVTQPSDAYYFDDSLKARKSHEDLTYQVREIFKDYDLDPYVLSTGCIPCQSCTYPEGPCRHPDRAFSTIESHGIHIMRLAKKLSMEIDFDQNMVLYFSMIFYGREE